MTQTAREAKGKKLKAMVWNIIAQLIYYQSGSQSRICFNEDRGRSVVWKRAAPASVPGRPAPRE